MFLLAVVSPVDCTVSCVIESKHRLTTCRRSVDFTTKHYLALHVALRAQNVQNMLYYCFLFGTNYLRAAQLLTNTKRDISPDVPALVTSKFYDYYSTHDFFLFWQTILLTIFSNKLDDFVWLFQSILYYELFLHIIQWFFMTCHTVIFSLFNLLYYDFFDMLYYDFLWLFRHVILWLFIISLTCY